MTAPPGHITAIRRGGDGAIELDLTDPFQGTVAIDRSYDLTTWQALTTLSAVAGNFTYTDPLPPPERAFYRLAEPVRDFRGSPAVSFAQQVLTVPEADTVVALPVIRRGPLDDPLDVNWILVAGNATPGDDYQDDSGVLRFEAGAGQASISLLIHADAAVEPDELVIVALVPEAPMETKLAAVVIADDDSPVTTVIAEAGLTSPYWVSNAGDPVLTIHQGRLFWNGPSDRRILSFGAGEQFPRTEATSFGIPLHVTTTGPWLVRLESESGISPGGCTGPGVIGKLVRSGLDGSDPLILDRPSLCSRVPPPVADAEAVYYVDTDVSPDAYHVRRVPINGGPSELLLTLTKPAGSLLVAGPWLWCFENRFPEPEDINGTLWRVAIDGSGAEVWLSGFRALSGQLVRDQDFIYLADTSYGGAERIQRISPVDRTARVVWETNDPSQNSRVQSLTPIGGRLFWMDGHSLRVMPSGGGTVGTLADDLEFPGFLAAGPGGLAWSDGAFAGRIRRVDPESGTISTLVPSLRNPGSMVYAGDTLIYSIGTEGYDEGSGRILALPPEGGDPLTIAGGFSAQQPPMVVGDDGILAQDKWSSKRLDAEGRPPVIVHDYSVGGTGFAADATSIYWASEPEGNILATNHDGGELRLLATAGGRPVDMQIQGSVLFWIDDPVRILSLPVSGGVITEVLAGAGGISSYLVDSQYVFVALQDIGSLVRLAQTGGPRTTLAGIPAFQHTPLAQTGNAVLWADSQSIWSVAKVGGAPQLVVQGLAAKPSALATDGAKVYWLDPDADRVCSATLPQGP